ncbi:MAG: sensor histidine kinase [Bacteroidales bacterium]|nr:sensor histidine kinase [Bacteroidales bacterium]
MTKQRKQENIVYLIIWFIIIAVPVLSLLYRASSDTNVRFELDGILKAWISLVPFLLIFVIHNYFIAPIFEKKGLLIYGILAILLVVSFGSYRYASDIRERNRWIQHWDRVNAEFWARAQAERDSFIVAHPEFSEPRTPFFDEDSLRRRPMAFGPGPRPMGPRNDSAAVTGFNQGFGFPEGREDRIFRRRIRREMAPNPMGPFSPALMEILLAIMMIAANMGVKLYFKGLENDKKVRDLEHENLLQQLQYLRYQINPHFFMNTLNNIHALVDIEPKEAKKSILELSKLMRYVLYEGGKPTIPLDKEVEFLGQYISLMRIRYTDSVKIDMSLPKTTTGVDIPPLLFISFVENAFKHGISYQAESFINVGMDVMDSRLLFWCENSRHETNNDPHSGIGLENVRKRLALLYGEDFTLDIDESQDKYCVKVNVPLQSHVVENLGNLMS